MAYDTHLYNATSQRIDDVYSFFILLYLDIISLRSLSYNAAYAFMHLAIRIVVCY